MEDPGKSGSMYIMLCPEFLPASVDWGKGEGGSGQVWGSDVGLCGVWVDWYRVSLDRGEYKYVEVSLWTGVGWGSGQV